VSAYAPAQSYVVSPERAAELASRYGLSPEQARILDLRTVTAGQDLNQVEIARRLGVSTQTVWRSYHDPKWLEALRLECQGLFAASLPELSEAYLGKAKAGDTDALRDVGRTVGLIAPEQMVVRHTIEDARVGELAESLSQMVQLLAGQRPLALPAVAAEAEDVQVQSDEAST